MIEFVEQKVINVWNMENFDDQMLINENGRFWEL
jgi:hypothetical protein